MNESKKLDYVDVVYSEDNKPLTDYPSKLTKYLFNRYKIKKGEKLLDIGCGRGEFLKGFINCGVKGHGVDQSNSSEKLAPEADLRIANLVENPIPFEDNYFDVVFSKSVIEHFHDPEILVKEIFRVLKPGGLIITMCPDWEFNYRIYFEDYTHKTPFMSKSLRDILFISGYENVSVEKFRQLPIIWSFKIFIIFSELTRLLVPAKLKSFKWVRFSKEIMLLSSANKPS